MGKNKHVKLFPTQTKLKKDPGVFKLAARKKEVQGKQGSHHTKEKRLAMVASAQMSFEQLAQDSSTLIGTGEAARLSNASSDSTISAHARQFAKVLDLANVIIQVLDARDPLGCRSRVVEDHVRLAGPDKKMILVLNKIDLVPRTNALAWIRYLRHDYPTIPLSSAPSRSRNGSAFPPTHLLTLLKRYRQPHTSLTIGVVGPPNVGKSSLINTLKRSRMAVGRGGAGGAASAADVCKVGAKPGETRDLKEVALEKGLKIIDSPGIVWGGFQGGELAGNLNMLDVDKLVNPTDTVSMILQRILPETLQSIYSIPAFADATEFLVMIALSRGRLGKGGTPDLEAAARSILHDWNSGQIPYHTDPPAVHPSFIPNKRPLTSEENVVDTTMDDSNNDSGEGKETLMRSGADVGVAHLVNKFSEPFDLDGLWRLVDEDVMKEQTDQVMEDGQADQSSDNMDEDGDPMESDDLRPVIPAKRRELQSLEPVVGRGSLTGKRQRTRPRYDGNAPDGLALVDDYERGTMAKSRKRVREELRKRKKRVTMEILPTDEVMAG